MVRPYDAVEGPATRGDRRGQPQWSANADGRERGASAVTPTSDSSFPGILPPARTTGTNAVTHRFDPLSLESFVSRWQHPKA
jgi:hypothetical protein